MKQPKVPLVNKKTGKDSDVDLIEADRSLSSKDGYEIADNLEKVKKARAEIAQVQSLGFGITRGSAEEELVFGRMMQFASWRVKPLLLEKQHILEAPELKTPTDRQAVGPLLCTHSFWLAGKQIWKGTSFYAAPPDAAAAIEVNRAAFVGDLDTLIRARSRLRTQAAMAGEGHGPGFTRLIWQISKQIEKLEVESLKSREL